MGEVAFTPQSVITLGAETCAVEEMRKQFAEKTKIVKTMLGKFPAVQDSQVEQAPFERGLLFDCSDVFFFTACITCCPPRPTDRVLLQFFCW